MADEKDYDPAVTDQAEYRANDVDEFNVKAGTETIIKADTGLPDPPTYDIQPTLSNRFQNTAVREIIMGTMYEQLHSRSYNASNAETWVRQIATKVRERVDKLNMKRYKIMVQVAIGEMRGAGFKSAMRALWDADCDTFVSDIFQSDTLFCTSTVYGVYFY